MADLQLESLVIDISANVSSASRGIASLGKQLTLLEETARKLDYEAIEGLKTQLESLANVDFSNVANSLRDVVSAMKALGMTKKEIKAGGDLGLTGEKASADIGGGLDNEPNFDLPLTFKGVFESVEQINQTYTKMYSNVLRNNDALESWRISLGECALSAKQVETVISDLDKLKQPEINFEKLKTVLMSLGFTADQAEDEMNKFRSSVKNAGEESKKTSSKLGIMLKQVKRILFYRAVRRAIQLIVQAFKEGIQDIALFDSDFNASMSQIMSSIKYLKNSLGALIAPLVEYLTPLITYLLDGLADVANKIAEVFASMSGATTFTKATKSIEDYAESLNKAKKATLGIDELNVLSNENDTSDYFETAQIGDDVKEYGKSIGNTLTTVQNIITKVLALVKEIVDIVLPLLNPVLDVVSAVLNVIEPVIMLVNLISPLLDKVVDIVVWLIGVITPLIDYIIASLKFVMALLTLDTQAMVDSLKKIGSSIINFFIAFGEGFINMFVGTINRITAGLSSLWTWLGIPAIPEIPTVSFGRVSFAQGGFPEDGMFFANHTELVGQFSNGKTAVANNEQIIEGIKQGVIEAMQTVNAGNGSGTNNITLEVDGREIARVSRKYNSQQGTEIIKGGYKYGY